MSDTIFSTLSIDRKKSDWSKYLFKKTPIEFIGNMHFKREDKFAPLGYGGINGSKLRQCIWLVDEYVNNSPNPVGVISGTSVKSPQLPMGSAVAMHYGLNSIHVIGATKPEIAGKHENVAMATWFGARFYVNRGIAYNPVLQRKVKQLLETCPDLKDYFYLEYGITLDHKINPPASVEKFHWIGSEQVDIPDYIEDLIIPAGSCNSCTSILYGLARNRPKNLKNVWLIGIGPNKIDFIEERLDIIQRISGVMTKPWNRTYHDSPDLQGKYDHDIDRFFDGNNEPDPFNVHHFDLHSTKYVDYQDEMPYDYHGLEMHPTYEGKVMTYVQERLPHLINDKTLFWIVGSKPRKEAMSFLCESIGRYPEKINEYIAA